MNKLLSSIIDLFLPPRCIKCGKVLNGEDGLCPDCFNEISFIARPYCERCGHPFDEEPSNKKMLCGSCISNKKNPFRLSRSAIKYDDASKNLVLAFKFIDKTENAKVMASWLKAAAKDLINEGVDVLVPVPLHYTRLIKRRYNQSALLAKELSKLTGIPIEFDAIERHIRTKPQVEFSGHARVKNVRNAFRVKQVNRVKNKRIVLIDDVLTTGSTVKECAIVLNKAGAKSVDTLTVARVC